MFQEPSYTDAMSVSESICRRRARRATSSGSRWQERSRARLRRSGLSLERHPRPERTAAAAVYARVDDPCSMIYDVIF